MNKHIIFIILVILLFSFIFHIKENFTSSECNSRLDESTGEFYCGDNNCCLLSSAGSYCNTTGESESSNNNLSEQQRQENRNFNSVVNPNKVYCVDFCVNTYTRTNPNDGNRVEFVDNNRLSSYITSNCAACIDNYYDRLNLIRNPNPVVNCTEPVD